MDIVILGAGNVGRALAGSWARVGHNVMVAVRDASRSDFEDLGIEGISLVEAQGAAAHGNVIVLAVPWPAVGEALTQAGDLTGKIVIDATNPLSEGLNLAVGHHDSGGETVARLAKGAKVVKAFNITGAHNMADSDYSAGPLMMPIASDDKEAKAAASQLAGDLGFEPVDTGPLSVSRYLEPMAMVWMRLALVEKMGTGIGFALLKR